MACSPWENSDSQQFMLITGANSGLGYAIATRLIDEFLTSSTISSRKHLILILCTRSSAKCQSTVSRVRHHLKKSVQSSPLPPKQRMQTVNNGKKIWMQEMLQRVHIYGAELDLCHLKSVYALANKLVYGNGSDALTIIGTPMSTLLPSQESRSIPTPPAFSKTENPESGQNHPSWELDCLPLPRIDAIILAAGMGGWLGIDILAALKDFLLNPIEAVTWPKYKIPVVGALVKSQSISMNRNESDKHSQKLSLDTKKPDEYVIGEVFCSNVLGHYILAHRLMPLLSRPATPSSMIGGKIIWVSSIEAMNESFSINDIQGLKASAPYESSKRLIDLLVLGSELPSVERSAVPFFNFSDTNFSSNISSEAPNDVRNKLSVKPKNYLTHPGIFASQIMPIHFILVILNILISYCVRFFGSPWHTINPYKAAVAPVWLAMTDNETLEQLEERGNAKAKWGSATDAYGNERKVRTEVPGWGCNGKVGSILDANCETLRKRSRFQLWKEDREAFEVLSGQCWKRMEELRSDIEIAFGLDRSTT